MKKILFSLVLFLCCNIFVSAQVSNNIWYFGNVGFTTSYGLDFTGGPPVRINQQSALPFYESVTVASNDVGDVQFYSDGIKIYDASHNLMFGMPSTGMLTGTQHGTTTASSVQGAFSVRVPGSDYKYILFTTAAVETPANGFRFHEIDLSLPGNGTVADPLGEITSFDNLLNPTAWESMTAYGVCGDDKIWIITHERATHNFLVVEVTSTGMNYSEQEVIMVDGFSDVSGPTVTPRGSMDMNNAGDRIVFTGGQSGTWLLDFDSQHGIISNPVQINDPNGANYLGYGSEFSPNDEFVYLGNYLPAGIWQHEILTGTSRWISQTDDIAEIITGPDGRLYIGKMTNSVSTSLAVIENPDNVVNPTNPAGSIGYNYNGFEMNIGGIGGYVSYAMPQGYVCSVSSECIISEVN